MKTRKDDFSPLSHPEEQNVEGQFVFKNTDGKYYKATVDLSPSSFMNFVVKNCLTKPFPWGEYVKHTTEAETTQYNGRKGHYIPAKNVNGIIASLIEEKVTQ